MSGLSNDASALGADVATALYGVTGQGVKIGIISDSYNAHGGAAANVAAGYLPSDVTVLTDDPSGADEGQAMTELAYQIAPDAQYYFAAGGDSIADCAAAVAALQAAGCTIIIDDLGWGTSESFYQTGTVLDQAISAAVAAGVNYFSAAGNDGSSYVQMGFTPISVDIPGIGSVVANDFGDGSPYLSLTIPSGDAAHLNNLLLEWAQPFASIGTDSAGAANSLAFYLLDAAGNVVASSTADRVGGDPSQALAFANTTGSDSFRLVVVQNGGTVPAGQNFTVASNNGTVTFDPALSGGGTGNIYGHELLSNTNVVGAANYWQSPAWGGTPTPADYTSVGPGTILYDSQGNPLSTPIDPASPTYLSVAGSDTTVPGFIPFNGTSAAAPNAGAVGALMLQANGALTTSQITALLVQSTIPVASDLSNTGAGLIQARAAVELANAASGVLWSAAAGGNWDTNANWAGGALPTTSGPAMLGNALGTLTTSYSVTVDSAGDAAGSLTLGAPSGMSVSLDITTGGTLSIGGPSETNITAGDFLVARGGTLSLEGGTLAVDGSLNSNAGTLLLTTGTATAANFAQTAGTLTLGTTLTLTDTTGFKALGGTVTIADAGTLQTTAFVASATSVTVVAGGTVMASGNALFNNANFTEAGSFTSAALGIYGTTAVISGTGVVTVQSLAVGVTLQGTTAPSLLTVNGVLVDQGALGLGASPLPGLIAIGSTGALSIGGATSNVSIGFSGSGGALDFTSSDSSLLTTGLTSVIYGFTADSGLITFGSLAYNPFDSWTYDDGTFSLWSEGTNLANLALDASNSYGGFSLSSGTNGALQIASIACFAQGTRIRTLRGEIPVEALVLGDRVVTATGCSQPVIWLGQWRVACATHPQPAAVQPVRIQAHAFGPGRPARDLILSPDHALYWEGVLIPAKYLVNGMTIRQEAWPAVQYFHVELATHDILLAENLPAESYLDTGDRMNFEGGPAIRLHPDWGAARMDTALMMEAAGYAPLRVTGPELRRAQALLRLRARQLNAPLRLARRRPI